VGCVDCDSALFLFWCAVNGLICHCLCLTRERERRANCRRQRRFAVVNVPNRSDVHVRLVPVKIFSCHFRSPFLFLQRYRYDI
jgi:hypothetical protein